MVKKISKTLIEKGTIERGYLGVGIQDVNNDLEDVYKEQKGAVVISIEKDSQAQKAGLKVWDLITKVNGIPIRSAAELKNIIGTYNPKDKVTLTILRDKKEQTLNITLTKALNNTSSNGSVVGGINGLEIVTLNTEIKTRFSIPNNLQGVFVTRVQQGSKAEEVGLIEGDIITQVESFSIKDAESFNEALNHYKGQSKRILVNRGGRVFSIVIR